MADLWMDVDTAIAEAPINLLPLLDDTDFKTKEESVVYNAAGLDLVWNFVTCAGAMTQTAVTPTDTGGNYDWVNQGNGHYSIEIPASGGASINNDTEGFGWFTGVATGVLPWRGPVIGFRAAGLNDLLIDSAYSATRGLTGTALPAVAADGAGGLPISDAGGLALDTMCAAALTAYDPPTKAEMDIAVGYIGESGTAQAGAAGSITLRAGASATDDLFNSMAVVTLSGTGTGQARVITDYNGTTKVAAVSPDWTTNPSSDTTYVVIPTPPAPTATGSLPRVDVREWLGSTVATPAVAGRPSVDAIAVSGDTAAADNLEAACDGTTYNIGGGAVVAASVTGAVGSVTGAVGSVTGAVGSVTGAVGSVTGSAGTWNAAWDAEVQSEVDDALVARGLDHLVAAAVTGTDIVDDSIIAKLVSKSAIADWDSFTNTTDSLEAAADAAFDPGVEGVDVTQINNVTLTGSGTVLDPWGPA